MDLGTLLVGSTPLLTDFALLVGRGFIGVCFVVHALGKLGLVGTGNMRGFVDWLGELGVPYPAVQARLAMLSELIGGSLLALHPKWDNVVGVRRPRFPCFLEHDLPGITGALPSNKGFESELFGNILTNRMAFITLDTAFTLFKIDGVRR